VQTNQLALYHFEGCPFCDRVRTAMKRLSIDIELRDIRANDEFRAQLEAATGRGTVPVLRIEESAGKVRWLPESLDIVAFLEQHFGR